MPNHSRITYLFNLYTQNKASEIEILELFELLKNLPAEEQLNPLFAELWNKVAIEETIQEPDWDELYQQVTGTKEIKSYQFKVKSSKNYWYYAAAAVFIGVFSVLLLSVFHQNNAATKYITYTVPYKTTKTIIFEDGSKAVLNAGTTMKYPKPFGSKTREIELDGEAFFQVVHLSNKPFIVHSGKLQTQVLGTSFNVDAYAKSTSMKVTVVSGKVSVKEASGGKQFMLTPNQQAVFSSIISTFKKVTVADVENKIAWQDGKLIFYISNGNFFKS